MQWICMNGKKYALLSVSVGHKCIRLPWLAKGALLHTARKPTRALIFPSPLLSPYEFLSSTLTRSSLEQTKLVLRSLFN